MDSSTTLASLFLVSLVPSWATPAAAQGEDCSSAEGISGTGSFPFLNAFAFTSGFDGNGGPNGCLSTITRDQFWSWNAPNSATYVFSLCDSTFDTQLALHSGSDCNALCLAFDDDSCSINAGSAIVLTLPAGEPVLIQLGGFASSFGSGTLEILELDTNPAGDTCADPLPISGLGSFPYDRSGHSSSGFDGGNPTLCADALLGAPQRDVFFAWTAEAAGSFRFTACTEGLNSELAVHFGEDCNATCLTSSQGAGCGGGDESLVHGLAVGDSLLVQLGDWSGGVVGIASGTLDVAVTAAPPPGDGCADAEPITGMGTFPFDTTSATASFFDGQGAPPCAGVDHHADVFLAWTAASDGHRWFEVQGLATRRMSLYAGNDCSATCLDHVDGLGAPLPTRLAQHDLVAGDAILVQIGGWSETSAGPGDLVISVAPGVPSNETCDQPETWTGLGTFPFDNTFASDSTFDGGNGACSLGASTGLQDVFFVWTAPEDGNFAFTSETTASIALYLGGDCNATCLDADTVDGDFVYTGDLLAGDTVLVQVGNYALQPPGPNAITVLCVGTCPPPPGIEVLCDPANVHFGGQSVDLGQSFPFIGDQTGMYVRATGGPPGEFGFVLVSATPTTGTPVFNGVLCLDTPIGRYNAQLAGNLGDVAYDSLGQFDANGEYLSLHGNGFPGIGGDSVGFEVPSVLPFTPPGTTIQPGDTWYFQLWYRDQVVVPGDSANFSNLIQVPFF